MTAVGPILWPSTAWLSMFVGLIALLYGFWPRAKQLHAWVGARIGRFVWVFWAAIGGVAAVGLSALWHRSRVDQHGICFVDFKVWHRDHKIAITANALNRNKGEVLVTLVGRRFWLDGYPRPKEPEVPESKPLYPEETVTSFDSQIVNLGQDVPQGTVLHGRVNFLVRYGTNSLNTAVLKIKGRVEITVGTQPNGDDGAYWQPDADSTPDCKGIENLIGRDWF